MKRPDWLKIRVESDYDRDYIFRVLEEYSINTVCNEAACPNMAKCYGKKTAAFIIMGKNCTRNCTFCNVYNNTPENIDKDEPYRLASLVKEIGLKHIVITSVTRDDLIDGGAGHFKKVIEEIRKKDENITIEVLIPDFKGSMESLEIVLKAEPDILAHNIETVSSLYEKIRPDSNYLQSLNILKKSKEFNRNVKTKSGIMLGLGETKKEIIGVLKDISNMKCDFMTIGQYLAPNKSNFPVREYVHPDVFDEYKEIAYGLGFKYVISEPFARSSYLADQYKE